MQAARKGRDHFKLIPFYRITVRLNRFRRLRHKIGFGMRVDFWVREMALSIRELWCPGFPRALAGAI